jgi:hypothetical protein
MHSKALAVDSDPREVNKESASLVEYDGPALLELTLDDTDYRIDVGKAGTALCISTRAHGLYEWQFAGEARWDGRRLRCRAFGYEVLERLAGALAECTSDGD